MAEFHDANEGDRITVEYESPEHADRQTVEGEVVYVDVNANDLVMHTWFVDDDGYLYRVGKNRISRAHDQYAVQEAAQKLADFDKADIPDTLMRLDGLTEAGQQTSAVEVLSIANGPMHETNDYEAMDDYELQAAALQEAREGVLSEAFNALLERQEQVHTNFIRAQAYGNSEQKKDELRIRSDRLRTGLKHAMDKAD